jgi:hypothetical protein
MQNGDADWSDGPVFSGIVRMILIPRANPPMRNTMPVDSCHLKQSLRCAATPEGSGA